MVMKSIIAGFMKKCYTYIAKKIGGMKMEKASEGRIRHIKPDQCLKE